MAEAWNTPRIGYATTPLFMGGYEMSTCCAALNRRHTVSAPRRAADLAVVAVPRPQRY